MPTINAPATQRFVEIDRIKDGVVILRNQSMRAILLISSLNFALKSQEEQEAIINRFQEYLNSLDFFVQLVVQSRKLNLDSYLKHLKDLERTEENELMRMQIGEYHDFVEALLKNSNIVQKTFYVVVPYFIGEISKRGALASVMRPGGVRIDFDNIEVFKEMKTQLWQRVEHVAGGLRMMGLRSAPLETQELIEFFYNVYNPTESIKKGVAEVDQLDLGEGAGGLAPTKSQ